MTVFEVSPRCLSLGLRAGAIVLDDFTVCESPPELRREIASEGQRVKQTFSSVADIRALPELVRARTIVGKVGVKPSDHPPSTQRLLEYAWKKQSLPAINNLVDAYNLVSIQARCSLGAHDLSLIEVPVNLGLFDGDAEFVPLGMRSRKPVNAGEFGYRDGSDRVLCRLNSIQADFSKVTHETRSALLIIESTDFHSQEEMSRVIRLAAEKVSQFCAAKIETVIPA